METKKYVSRPVEIEAVQFTGEMDNRNEILAWIGLHGGTATYFLNKNKGHQLAIHTLEGVMDAYVGWWIIKGTEGEFYPCKPSVFERKYDEVRPKIEVHINEPVMTPRRREYIEYYD